MSKEILPIAIDTLGGDHAPLEVVKGAVASEVPCILVGPEQRLTGILEVLKDIENIAGIVNAEEVVGNEDNPVSAVRNKKSSTMMTAIQLVKDGTACGVMSPGNTGAFMMGATMMLGRLPNVTRPAAAITIPTPSGLSLLLDAGASTDCTPEDLVGFAVLGSTFAHTVWGIEKPRVGLLSIGEEEMKGTKVSKEAYQVLKASNLNFIGNVEGSDLGTTGTDVIVTDGFTGNVALKSAEGISSLIMGVVKEELKATRGIERAAAWVLYPLLNRIRTRLDWREYGGGALLGVKGNVVIAHGKSKSRAISTAIKFAADLAQTDVLSRLEEAMSSRI